MTQTNQPAPGQDAFIIQSLKEAERRRLNRMQTIKYIGLPAEAINQAVRRTLASVPSLPEDLEDAAPVSAEAEGVRDEPAVISSPDPTPPSLGLERGIEAAASTSHTLPAVHPRKAVAAQGRAKLKAAMKTRVEGTGEGLPEAATSEPRRAHGTKKHKAKATRQQIHASVDTRILTLIQMLDAGRNVAEIAKEMNLGTARVYQIARQAGRPFGGSSKLGKATQETSAA